jgi:hypothetical protein
LSWLAPLYLAGLLAIAGPVLFHLWRRTPQGRRKFSTLMFLSPSPPRITRRSRIEQWLLLVLRALACGFLALAFARPVWRVPAEIAHQPRGGELLAILVDTSASMRREGLWEQVRQTVRQQLAKLPAEAHAALFAYDDQFREQVSFKESLPLEPSVARALIEQRLQALEPTWLGSRTGEGLVRTAQALQEAQAGRALPRPQRILLVTDLQTGCRLDSLQGFDWPRDIPVELAIVGPRAPTNAAVHYVAPAVDLADDKTRVRVTNAEQSVRADFTLHWVAAASAGHLREEVGRSGASAEVAVRVHVPPGQSRVIALPEPPTEGVAAIELAGDDHPFDNRLWLPYHQPQRCTVLYVGRDDPHDVQGARFYWERALASNPRYEVTVVTADQAFSGDPPVMTLATHAEPVGTALLPKLLAADRQVVLAPRTAEDAVELLAACGVTDVTVHEAKVRDFALWSDLDFESPWLAPFAEARFADFSGVYFWKHRLLIGPSSRPQKVLVCFDSGHPAVVQWGLPSGQLWCFLAGWQPSDSQLARSTKFVPLMWGILEQALGATSLTTALSTGQGLPAPRGAASWTITPPGGEVVAWDSTRGNFEQTETPGRYILQVDQRREVFAVNVPPDESRTDPLPPEQLEAYGVRLSNRGAIPAAETSAVQLRQQQLMELEQHQQLWRWGVLTAVLLVLTETMVAAWKLRQGRGIEEALSP